MRWPLLLLATATARAEPPPLVLRDGSVAVQLVGEASLAPGALFRPLSVAPDGWFGVTSRLTLGVIHSDLSIDRIAPKASLCIRQDNLLCTRTYRGSAIDVRYSALAGVFTLVPHVRVLLRDVDPIKPAVTLGAALRWTRGRTTITSDPFLQLGIANTDRGNRSALWLPLVVTIAATDRFDAELSSGWNSDLAVIRDGWHVPFELAVRARVVDWTSAPAVSGSGSEFSQTRGIGQSIDVRLGLGFTSLLGPQNTPKQRVVSVAVRWDS